MRRSNIFQASFYFLSVLSLAACGGGGRLPYRIETGKIDDAFDIVLTEKKVTLKQNETFELARIGLKASEKSWKWNAADTEVKYAELTKNKYPAYDITMTKKGYKMYFGKILFFNLSSDDKNKALSRSTYQIKIDSRYFDAAKDGKIVCVNDSPRQSGKKASKKTIKPTWIIWMSDSPFN